MLHDENVELLNLCVDESGTAALGINPYRFFLLTAVVINEDQQELACLLFTEWRKKYLKNPSKSLHTADFFEDFENDYKKPELRIEKHFKSAVDDLLDILKHINFFTEVYYIDLKELRKKLGVTNVPEYREAKDFTNSQEKREYYQKRKIFEKNLSTAHKGNLDKPYILPLFELFQFHNKHLELEEKKDPFKRKFKGFINFESLSGADVKSINYFHKFKEKINFDYRHRVVGINFPTKNSLDGGIEIADIISYVSYQTLRFSHKLAHEMKTIPEYRKKQLKRMRTFMRKSRNIELVNVTNRNIPKKQKELT